MTDYRDFVLKSTAIAAPPLLPELPMYLASEVTPLWHATEKELAAAGVEPPYWAFAWAGGQGVARYILDNPESVRGRRVLDFASGSGLIALAAAKAGAARVVAIDRDPVAVTATALNAERLQLPVEARCGDVLTQAADWLHEFDVITAGDVCYDLQWSRIAVGWLRERARAGAEVLLGDPGRMYLPQSGREEVARYTVPTIDDIEGQKIVTGYVYRLYGVE